MLTCIKLHTKQLLFHVDIKMEPFRHEDDDAFLHDIICESGEDAEYDGSQYLNDTGEAMLTSQSKWPHKTIQPKLVLKFVHTYIYMYNFMMNSVSTNVQRV